MYRAFQGPNGWYVAFEREDGFHRQPQNGGNMSERDARREARDRNEGGAVRRKERDMEQRITVEPGKMGGVPCVRGLRIPAVTVLRQLVAGRSEAEILRDHPDLEAEDLREVLAWALETGHELAYQGTVDAGMVELSDGALDACDRVGIDVAVDDYGCAYAPNYLIR